MFNTLSNPKPHFFALSATIGLFLNVAILLTIIGLIVELETKPGLFWSFLFAMKEVLLVMLFMITALLGNRDLISPDRKNHFEGKKLWFLHLALGSANIAINSICLFVYTIIARTHIPH